MQKTAFGIPICGLLLGERPHMGKSLWNTLETGENEERLKEWENRNRVLDFSLFNPTFPVNGHCRFLLRFVQFLEFGRYLLDHYS